MPSFTTEESKELRACGHEAGAERSRCGVCGAGECGYCNDWACLRDDSNRPGNCTIDGVSFTTCGRSIRAGELSATYITLSADKRGTLRFGLCMGCFDRARHAGVPETRFMVGRITNCLTCGYHSARLESETGSPS